MATIRVSNNKDTYEVDESDLPKALKDGFTPLVSVSKGDSKFDVHPDDLPKALADGYRPIQHSDSGLVNTIVSQVASGATAGFDDELAGGLSAIGRVAGIKGLGGKIKDLGLADDGPTLDFDKIKQALDELKVGKTLKIKPNRQTILI